MCKVHKTLLSCHGFSLIEIIVSIAALSLVLGAGWFSFSFYAARQELQSGAARVSALIAEARGKTLAGEGGAAWGVHFDNDKAALFRAPNYQAGSADNKTEILPRRITVSAITFLNNEVVFARLTGASNAGSVTLAVRGNPSISKIISINALGVVESE